MKILIIGATGRTGKLLVNEAVNAGHKVHVLVRNGDAFKESQKLLVFVGMPSDIEALKDAMAGCETVINALNVSRTSDFPWSKLRTPPDLLSVTMRHVINLCNQLGVKRVITVSAWGAGDSRNEIPGWFKWLIDHSNIKYPYIDHERQEELLKASGLDYTIVRPVGLTNSLLVKPVVVSTHNNPKPGLTISRSNVAKFIIAEAENGYIRQTITVSE